MATVMNLGRIRRIAPATWGQIRMRPHLGLHYALLPKSELLAHFMGELLTGMSQSAQRSARLAESAKI